MKFKYFLRGIGVGILFSSLIYVAAYQTSPNKLLTDEDVIARAKELGMVESPTQMEELLNEQTSEDTSDVAASSEDTTLDAASVEQTTESTTKASTEEQTTETSTEEATPEATSEEPTTEEISEESTTEQKVITARITIKRGMQSITVARMLEREGIISDASDFDQYLNKQGYSTKLRVGTYTVKSSYSYAELAQILTGRS